MTMDKRNSSVKVSGKSGLELRGKYLSLVCTLVLLAVVSSIICMVTLKGLATFTVNHINPFEFFFGTDWSPGSNGPDGRPLVGAFPMIFGSFVTTVFSTILAAPLAIGTAIFIVELSPGLGRKVVQPAIQLLVGVPSVVYGLLGLTLIVPFLRTHSGGTGFGVLAASLVLTVMVLPTISSISTDAIAAVSDSRREAALALGATRWQMIRHVVLRDAASGILTAVVLGMTRAFGEALAVQMVIGNTTLIPRSLTTAASTLTSILTMGMGNTIPGQLENNVLWTLALVLLAMSLLFIVLIHRIGGREA